MRGKFTALNSREIRVDLFGRPPDDKSFALLSACVVNFGRGNKTYLFLANVIGQPMPTADGGTRIRLSYPDDLLHGEVRRAFRIPIDKLTDLQASLSLRSQRRIALIPLDIGYVGMRAEFVGRKDWQAEEVDSVHLSLHEEQIKLRVEVRQERDRQLGMFFPGVMKQDDLNPPKPLHTIIKTLESEWLRQRRHQRR